MLVEGLYLVDIYFVNFRIYSIYLVVSIVIFSIEGIVRVFRI